MRQVFQDFWLPISDLYRKMGIMKILITETCSSVLGRDLGKYLPRIPFRGLKGRKLNTLVVLVKIELYTYS